MTIIGHPGALLEVKVLPPALPPRALPRPRVTAAIAGAVAHRLTTVVAGAGFGKTTALSEYAAGRPVAWYTTSVEDCDVLTLASGLMASLRLRVPTVDLTLPASANAYDEERAVDAHAAAIGSALAAAIQDAAPSSLVLVVDDVHELTGGSGGAALLEALVRQLPDRVRVVLAGRDEPPFPTRRLQTRGQTATIGATDLALNSEETQALLAAELGDDTDVGALAAELRNRTGGWPAAVRLAIDLVRAEPSSNRLDVIQRVLGQPGPLTGALVAEVLDSEAESVVDTLARLSHIDRFTPELAAAVIGPDAPALISRVAPRGVYLVALGGPWWAVHPMVRGELRSREPGLDREGLRTAAAWLAEHDGAVDALRLLAEAGDHEGLAGMLVQVGSAAIAAGHAAAVATAADELPPQLRSLAIDVVDGEARQAMGDWSGAMERLERVVPASGPIPAGIAWRLGLLYHFRGELGDALSVYERGGEGPLNDRALLAAWHGSARWLVGDRDRSAALAAEAADLARESGDRQAQAAAHTALALVAALDGDRVANDAHYLRALDHAMAAGDLVQATRIRANRGSRSMEEGRYEEALTELDEAVRLAEISGSANFGALALLNRGQVLLRLGRLDEARRDLGAAIDIEQRIDSRMIAYPMASLGDLYRLRGDAAQARAAYEEAIATATAVGDVQGYVPALAGMARLLAETGQLQEAKQRADEALGAPTSLGHTGSLLAAACVAMTAGDMERARDFAEQAATAARDRRDRAALAEALEIMVAAGATSGDTEAEAHLGEARAIYEELGEPLSLARIDLARAERLGVDQARPVITESKRMFERLGARPLAATAERRLAELDRVATPALAFRVLGDFAVQRAGETLERGVWQSKKARDLVKILIARRGRPAHREELVALMWPDEDAAKANARLSVALSTARSVIDPEKQWSPDHVIRSDGTTIQLQRENVWIDLEAFMDAASTGLRAHAAGALSARELLGRADALYTGDLLEEDRYEDWPVALREELRGRYLEVTRALIEQAEAAGDHDGAIRAQLRLLEQDPYDEHAHLGLARTLSAAGRHGEARRAHSTYCRRMAELGIEPAPFPGTGTTTPQ